MARPLCAPRSNAAVETAAHTPGRRGLELRGQRLGLARARTPASLPTPTKRQPSVEPMARVGFDPGENAGRLAAAQNPSDRVVDGRSHVGVRVVAEVSQIGRQIARADEERPSTPSTAAIASMLSSA